jgi:hypothetical protein
MYGTLPYTSEEELLESALGDLEGQRVVIDSLPTKCWQRLFSHRNYGRRAVELTT